MPLIIKGSLINKGVVVETTPTTIKQQEPVKEIIESDSHYHEVHEGELHKLFNKKSDYLRDALDLDNHK